MRLAHRGGLVPIALARHLRARDEPLGAVVLEQLDVDAGVALGDARDLKVASYELRATSCELQAMSYKLQATSYELQVTSYKLQATPYKLQAPHEASRSFLSQRWRIST